MNKRIKKKLIKQYCMWKKYETGFAGHGTSLLDKKPRFPKPKRLPQKIKKQLDKEFEEFAKHKRDAWRMACIDILGEDPVEDWGVEE